MCPQCHSIDNDFVELAGTGTIYSYAILHHPQHPAFDYPVLAALVDLDEGVRVVTNVQGLDSAELAIGIRVRVKFEPTADDMAVAVFEPVEGPT
jgi:uncharacterized OB-fold protein